MTDPSREMRISDSDRQAAADRLQAASNEGRLSVAEYDDRLGRLYQAVTYGDVAALFADLPHQQPVLQSAMPQMAPPMSQPMPPPQQTVGPMTGPGAVVQNTIVVNSGVAVLPSSGFATAGLVFGILCLIGFWVPFGDVLCAGLAVLFSALGLGQTRRGYSGSGKAIAGLVMGLIGLIPAIIVISLLVTAAAFI